MTIRGEDDSSNERKARKAVASRDTEWWQLRTALHQIWAFHTTRNGKEILPEDMEKYALRAILSCRSFKRTNIQNMAFFLADKEQEIIDLRANGSLSPFYLSYFLGMEPSSPFYTNY